VLIGVRAEDRKELIALTDGYREASGRTYPGRALDERHERRVLRVSAAHRLAAAFRWAHCTVVVSASGTQAAK
jgi:hypothetical protein